MITNTAVLVDLNISVWTGRKMDRKVSDEIDATKNTRVRGGNYHKHLLAGTQKLEQLQKLVAGIRLWHYNQTLPWSDGGSRLLPMANFFDYKQKLNTYQAQFDTMVAAFLADYPTLVTAAAFQLGDLFDSAEYPDAEALKYKFKFRFAFMPVPEAGDFRIDAAEDDKKELRTQYEKFYNDKLSEAMQDVWTRLHECVAHMSDKLADAETPRESKDGSKNFTKIFRDSLVDNANELCELMTRLNVTGDPKLEKARQMLESAVNGKTAETLRDSDEVRLQTKAKVDEILGMF